MEACPAVPTLSQGHLCEPWSAVQTRKDHQELPNSSLTNATCPSPAHPENIQGTQNLSLWDNVRKGEHTIASTLGISIFCILSSKPLSLAPFFAVSFVSRMYICNHSELLRQKGLSPLFLGAVNSFQSQKFPALQTTY